MKDARFWDKIAPKYAKDPIDDMAAYTETLNRMHAVLRPEHRVIELGCGTGSTALELAGGVDQYTGTDVSGGMIEIARGKLGPGAPENLRFEVAPAGGFPDQPVDVVLALNLLHLVRDLEAVIAKVFDALPKGGLFISKTGLIGAGAWYLPLAIAGMRLVGKAPYVRALDEAGFKRLITDAGFEIEDALLQPGLAPRLYLVARKP